MFVISLKHIRRSSRTAAASAYSFSGWRFRQTVQFEFRLIYLIWSMEIDRQVSPCSHCWWFGSPWPSDPHGPGAAWFTPKVQGGVVELSWLRQLSFSICKLLHSFGFFKLLSRTTYLLNLFLKDTVMQKLIRKRKVTTVLPKTVWGKSEVQTTWFCGKFSMAASPHVILRWGKVNLFTRFPIERTYITKGCSS